MFSLETQKKSPKFCENFSDRKPIYRLIRRLLRQPVEYRGCIGRRNEERINKGVSEVCDKQTYQCFKHSNVDICGYTRNRNNHVNDIHKDAIDTKSASTEMPIGRT